MRASTPALGSSTVPALALALVLTLHATSVHADADGACSRVADGRVVGAAIRLDSDGSKRARRALADGVAMWTSCAGYGQAFPRFATRDPAFRVVHVRLAERSPANACGEFTRDSIVLYAWAHNGAGRLVPCAPFAQNLAHELGHVLGLFDAPPSARCRSHIMAPDDRDGPLRIVESAECAAVAAHWIDRCTDTALQNSAATSPARGASLVLPDPAEAAAVP